MLDFSNITKAFGTQVVLSNVSLRINDGERVGIVGPNGAGKSTLFSLINAETSVDKGNISIPNNQRISCLHQHVLHDADGNIRLIDYVADAIPRLREIRDEIHAIDLDEQYRQSEQGLKKLGDLQHEWEILGGYRLETEAKIALAGLGFQPGSEFKKIREFSGGWQMRAALARTLIADPDILLLDEPSNYLDVPAIEWLDRYLSTFEGTLLLISHDRYLLRTLVNVIVEINNGQCVRYNGDYNYYEREREQRALNAINEQKSYERQKEHMEDFINRFRSKSSKAASVQSMIKQLDKFEAAHSGATIPEKVKYAAELRLPPPPPCGSVSLVMENAGFGYAMPKFIFRNLNLEIPKGEKVAVLGYNGMGKTTLLRTMAGVVALNEGTRQLGHNVVVGYQSQEFSDVLDPLKSCYDVVRAVLPATAETKHLRALLGAFGFSGSAQDKQVEVLSGGEKIRLCFARIFAAPPNLLLLDEPTTHLDIRARETLQDAIINYAGTCVFVSHDIEFLRACATHIIAVTPHGIKRYFGDYDYYLRKLDEENAPPLDSSSSKQTNVISVENDPVSQKDQRRLRAEKRQALAKAKGHVEKKIAKYEQQIECAEIEMQTIVESFGSGDPSIDFAALNKRQKDLSFIIAEATEAWEQATDEYAQILKDFEEK